MKQPDLNDDQGLGKALDSWKLSSSLPPRFNEMVWSKISSTRNISVREILAERFSAVFSRPAVAWAYVGILMLTGISGGYFFGTAQADEIRTTQMASYIQYVDPYAGLRK